MPQTFVRFDDGSTAQVTAFLDVGHTLYGFGQDLILVKPAYYGRPDRHAVTISLGRPGDKSGYGLTGLHIGDWFLTGTVMCTGYDFTPRTHPHARGVNPLDDIADPDARQAAADYLSQIASHFHTTIAPGIKW